MFKSEPMCKATILVLNRHAEQVTARLGTIAVLHLLDATAQFHEIPFERAASEQAHQELRQQYDQCIQKLREVESSDSDTANALRIQCHDIDIQLTLLEARRNIGQSSHVSCIVGWLPKSAVQNVRTLVQDETAGTGIVRITNAEDDPAVLAGQETIPFKFNVRHAWQRPFMALVTAFGAPRYTQLDPTLFVALTFVLLFGFMFGDVGQGAVLLALGLYACRSRRPFPKAIRDGGIMLSFCGATAILFGFAYGSVFGYENLLPALWLNPMAQPTMTQLLLTAIAFGVVFSSMAILFNIANNFLAKRYYDGTFDRFGIIGLLFYWLCLAVGIWLATGHTWQSWMIALLLLPLVLIFLKHPLKDIFNRHAPFHESGFIIGFMEAVIEVLETLTGYLSSTVSFVRIGAYAISHAALCFAIYTIIHMFNTTSPAVALPLQILIGILGNILVIAFEGMVAMIQCIRLEYYELFGKFFSGDGVPYTPLSLSKDKLE